MTKDNQLFVQIAVASSSAVRGMTFLNTGFKEMPVRAEKSSLAFSPAALPMPLRADGDRRLYNQPGFPSEKPQYVFYRMLIGIPSASMTSTKKIIRQTHPHLTLLED